VEEEEKLLLELPDVRVSGRRGDKGTFGEIVRKKTTG